MDPATGISLASLAAAIGTTIVNWKRSNRTARDADARANEADARANEANEIAQRAVQLAMAAENRADRIEQAQRERRDVRWRRRRYESLAGHDGLAFFNEGADAAHEVYLHVVGADGTLIRPPQRCGLVEQHGRVGIDLTSEISQRRVLYEDATRKGWAIDFGPHLHVLATVTWTSELGVPGTQPFDLIEL